MKSSPLKIAFIAPGSLLHTVKWINGLAADTNLAVTLITQHKIEDKVDDRVNIRYLPFSGGKGYILNALALNKEINRLLPDVINVHYASGYGTLALLSNIKPYILSVWGSDVYEFPFQSKLKYWLIRKSLNNAKRIASTSHAMAKQTRTLIGDRKLPIAITPFGVDLSRFNAKTEPFNSEFITVGVVKRLEYKYGIDLLIDAFAALKSHYRDIDRSFAAKLKLMIVGDGSLENELIVQCDKLNIYEDVEFVGAVNNNQVPDYIDQIDLFVVPSRIESFGVAAIEALACERPCIVANTGGLPEVVINKNTGLVCDYESAESIAQCLIWAIENPQLVVEMGKQGREDVLRKYSQQAAIDIMKKEYIAFYDDYSK
ncbi:glycosyltransferase family 4 protein [Thalassotalea sp. M1531]|uniref:Glycosyltransferase family 4 protein n=1 Tax=Thalassotalea algicola TaxID=2716224 RepID=A0A7Y0Q988_9GAMM|nr:glycosyltransferase [Thalassotalea algicola]NMP32960.1 glycosyltransferase family 4 protein [Thalassotalea algicola]